MTVFSLWSVSFRNSYSCFPHCLQVLDLCHFLNYCSQPLYLTLFLPHPQLLLIYFPHPLGYNMVIMVFAKHCLTLVECNVN